MFFDTNLVLILDINPLIQWPEKILGEIEWRIWFNGL